MWFTFLFEESKRKLFDLTDHEWVCGFYDHRDTCNDGDEIVFDYRNENGDGF